MFDGLQQVNLRVRDVKQSMKWYQDILGLRMVADFGNTVVLDFGQGDPDPDQGGSGVICLIQLPEGEEPPTIAPNGTYPVLRLSRESVEEARDILERTGVKTEGSQGHFTFCDPDGNQLEAYLPGLYRDETFARYR